MADALDSGSSEVTLIQVQVLLSAPQKESFNRKVGAFLFVLGRSGLEPFQAPAIRTTKKRASIVRSELFFLSRSGQDLNLFKLLLSAPQKESFDRKIGAFLFVSAGRYPVRTIQFVQVRRLCCLRTCFCLVTKLPQSRPARQLPCTIPSSHRWRRCEKNRFHTCRSSPASACQPPQNQPYRVDPHARIVCRDSVFPVRAKAEIVFLQAKSECFFLSGYQNFLLKSIRHLNKESCRQTAKYTKILDILPSPPYNRKNHSAKAA